MKKDLAIKQIYDDFINKIILNDNEKDILLRYIKDDTIIKIANDTSQSTSSVSRVIADLKKKYQQYKDLELAKLILFQKDKWYKCKNLCHFYFDMMLLKGDT